MNRSQSEQTAYPNENLLALDDQDLISTQTSDDNRSAILEVHICHHVKWVIFEVVSKVEINNLKVPGGHKCTVKLR